MHETQAVQREPDLEVRLGLLGTGLSARAQLGPRPGHRRLLLRLFAAASRRAEDGSAVGH